MFLSKIDKIKARHDIAEILLMLNTNQYINPSMIKSAKHSMNFNYMIKTTDQHYRGAIANKIKNKKIPHYRKYSKIKYQNRREGRDRYP